jgi:1,4-alpha-glucan branching enzyme
MTSLPRPDESQRPSRILTDFDIHLFNEGTHVALFEKLGAHPDTEGGRAGVRFAVWAPNAAYVAVIGDFNGWDKGASPMRARGASGIWELFVPGLSEGARYKFHVASRFHGYAADKADPYGFMHDPPPSNASVVRSLDYAWNDAEWMERRRKGRQGVDAPMSIYEVHLPSWRTVPEEGDRPLSYRELAAHLAEYCLDMGFTHVEFLPVMEHPFPPSWGYQVTGYFAPTSRQGAPQDFMHLIDTLHRAGIGVILDWVPSHFPTDEHGLIYFDGTHLYEHADDRQGFHPDWKTAIFNYGRHEVRAFLISNALFWLEKYHADGLRVDAVASMLYLDYGRRDGEWVPNKWGGKENVEAIDFMRHLNRELYARHPDTCTIAEESTAWSLVSAPVHVGGLGFGFKWDMGWMHDTLKYLSLDPVYRKHHHTQLTFRGLYQFSENYVLALSHDEVVHLKGSLLRKMAGDEWQRFANLRLLLANQWAQTGKKLLFMGGEIAQWTEWAYDKSLDWHVLADPRHAGVQRLVRNLNRLYRDVPALHQNDCRPEGFEWIDANDWEQSCASFLRKGKHGDAVLCVFNHTPVERGLYRVGVPRAGRWEEILNTDAAEFGGAGKGNLGGLDAQPVPHHAQPWSLSMTLPALSSVWFRLRSP